MKKGLLRISLLLMSALLLLPVIACGEHTGGDVTTKAPDAATAASTVDENGYILSDLPELNFNEAPITVLYWSDREHEEFFVEATNGENVNDALYVRNVNVEDKLNVKLNFIGTPGNASNISNFRDTVYNSVANSAHEYDIIAGYSISTSSCAANGTLLDMLPLNYLNFDMPWWPDNLIDQATINGKLYFASGDISANVLYMMYVNYFNKSLVETYEHELPYALADNGEWTLEKMIEYSNGVYSDENNNNKQDEGDLYGFYGQKLHSDAFFWGAGLTAVDNSGSELLLSEDWTGEAVQNLLNTVCTFLYDTGYAKMITSDTTYAYFRDGLSMFWFDRARQGANLTDIQYGILPIPKQNTEQENYACVMGNPFTLYGIIADEKDPDMVAAVIECMASESYRNVTPQLFEITMKYKYSEEEAASRMYDIVRSSVVFDLGRIFYSSLNGVPASTWEGAVVGNNRGWSTMSGITVKQLNKSLEKLMENFD